MTPPPPPKTETEALSVARDALQRIVDLDEDSLTRGMAERAIARINMLMAGAALPPEPPPSPEAGDWLTKTCACGHLGSEHQTPGTALPLEPKPAPEPTHTPTPWRTKTFDESQVMVLPTSEHANALICTVSVGRGRPQGHENAAFIVRAANAHEALVAALIEVGFEHDTGSVTCRGCGMDLPHVNADGHGTIYEGDQSRQCPVDAALTLARTP